MEFPGAGAGELIESRVTPPVAGQRFGRNGDIA